ncbi:MAG: hypothetical protein ACFBSF_11075 [Leptolyngbyaceae cyanobacterium]
MKIFYRFAASRQSLDISWKQQNLTMRLVKWHVDAAFLQRIISSVEILEALDAGSHVSTLICGDISFKEIISTAIQVS